MKKAAKDFAFVGEVVEDERPERLGGGALEEKGFVDGIWGLEE